MKRLITMLIVLSIILAQDSTLRKIPKINFMNKGLNIKGVIPKQNKSPANRSLGDQEIEFIKEQAKNFKPEPVSENDIVVMETSKGTIKLRLFPELAPQHCLNFKKLANSGFYDGTKFHRVIPGFMIQGGDILSRDTDVDNDGTGSPGWTVPAEFSNEPHKKGILSMARSREPNSAGSQFFICVADALHLDGKYSVFGEVIENLSVVDRIVSTPTISSQFRKICKEKLTE